MIVGFAFLPKITSAYATEIQFAFGNGDTCTMTLDMGTGRIEVDSSNGQTSETTAASLLVANVWQYVEFRAKSGSSTGEVEVYHNEVQVINAINQDTGGEGENIVTLRIRATDDLQQEFIDDLYLLDTTGSVNNTFLGDSRITAMYVLGDGAVNNFTMTTDISGETFNWQGVHESPSTALNAKHDRDHSYVESGLIGAREEYDNSTMAVAGAGAVSVVHGVQVVNSSKKTSSGVLKYKDEMIIAGTRYDNGVDVIATTGDYHMSTFVRDTDPSDSAVWTEAKVNAVGSGFVITVRDI